MKCGLFLTLITVLPATAETLHYTINWQSGLSLGEASLENSRVVSPTAEFAADGGWMFQLTLDAALPGQTIRDEYKSKADSKFCSEELERTLERGSGKSIEKSTFDQQKKKVTRETQSEGVKSEMESDECAHDALAFLQFVRQELAQGRLVPHQSVFFGSKYDLQVTYVGRENIRLTDKRVEADQVRVSTRGPETDLTFEVFFAKDDTHTPLMARLPLSMGTFTVELLD